MDLALFLIKQKETYFKIVQLCSPLFFLCLFGANNKRTKRNRCGLVVLVVRLLLLFLPMAVRRKLDWPRDGGARPKPNVGWGRADGWIDRRAGGEHSHTASLLTDVINQELCVCRVAFWTLLIWIPLALSFTQRLQTFRKTLQRAFLRQRDQARLGLPFANHLTGRCAKANTIAHSAQCSV